MQPHRECGAPIDRRSQDRPLHYSWAEAKISNPQISRNPSFAQMGAEHCRPDTSRHPGMHKTRTIDYVILLAGELTLLLERGEVQLKPFDVVVQRGTNHAWVNKGKTPAILGAVLIDAHKL